MQKEVEYWNSKEAKVLRDYQKGGDLWKKSLHELFWSFHEKHRRDFSWRNRVTPYRVMVSELMLQQTQTGRVIEKFSEFMKMFPSIKSLAEASSGDVLKVWSGLGYNRRALYLHKAAGIILNEFKSRIPENREDLLSLPGIGTGTAAAIRVFAFNIPDVIIETNVRTVYRRIFFPEKTAISDSEIAKLVEESLDIDNPREWFYAIMDYGVYLKQQGYQVNNVFKGYQKQSRFEGSRRQVRGAVLKRLVSDVKVSRKRLYRDLEAEYQRTEAELNSICSDLIKEGLIYESGAFLCLTQ